jgi:hypothetical protein
MSKIFEKVYQKSNAITKSRSNDISKKINALKIEHIFKEVLKENKKDNPVDYDVAFVKSDIKEINKFLKYIKSYKDNDNVKRLDEKRKYILITSYTNENEYPIITTRIFNILDYFLEKNLITQLENRYNKNSVDGGENLIPIRSYFMIDDYDKLIDEIEKLKSDIELVD